MTTEPERPEPAAADTSGDERQPESFALGSRRKHALQRPRRSQRRMLLGLVAVGAAFWVLKSRSTQEGCTRLTRQLEAQPPAPASAPP